MHKVHLKYLKFCCLGCNIRQEIICLSNLTTREKTSDYADDEAAHDLFNHDDVEVLSVVKNMNTKRKDYDPNHDGSCESHTPLTRGSKRCSDQLQRIKCTSRKALRQDDALHRGTWLTQYSLLASGMITPWFLAPMLHYWRTVDQCQRRFSLKKTWTLFPFAEPLL